MDAVEITAYRTAAASAVATKYLATESPKILAVLGAGTQAKSHVLVMTTMFRFEQVRADIRKTPLKKWCGSGTTVSRRPCLSCKSSPHWAFRHAARPSVEDAVRDSDVVVTATSSAQACPGSRLAEERRPRQRCVSKSQTNFI
ncbi:hypothetical protein HPB51_017081 [Rhipicephalus microplus]|uniref:Ketimine reductase mu-crystallin n=1 Tax=Rhipicephalus microplus TaxID=6941 RepID=A0A9J6F533_RHIMP|nr:hypothetical protein HPB51_017081 [Rhipicephalus microplus]